VGISDQLSQEEVNELLMGSEPAEPPPEKEEKITWPNPEPIESTLKPVIELPPAIIPDPFKAWAVDVAHRMQCPLDFVVVAMMVMAGSVIGAGCGIRPKQRDDWEVVPNLWGAPVGGPSTLKTPALQEALKPIAKLETEAKKQYDEALCFYEADYEVFKAQRDALKDSMKATAKGKNKEHRSLDELKEEYATLQVPKAPVWKRYKTNDATIEKIAELLAQNERGLLIFRDELVGLLASWEKENRQSDRAFFLEAWNGTGGTTSDRIGRGTVHVDNLCISLIGGIQPAKLLAYLYQAQSELENDGLIQRMQLIVYPDENKNWELVDKYPDYEAKNRVFKVIDTLAGMQFEYYGAQTEGKRPIFQFDSQAQELFYIWITELEEKLKQDDQPVILEHLGKYRSLMPSLSLIDHLICLADGAPAGPVTLESARRAAAWCEYLESHARRVYGLIADIRQKAAAELAKKLKTRKLKDGFSQRDIYRNGWHLLTDPETVKAACIELIEAGWIREQVAKDTKKRLVYTINPKILMEKSK